MHLQKEEGHICQELLNTVYFFELRLNSTTRGNANFIARSKAQHDVHLLHPPDMPSYQSSKFRAGSTPAEAKKKDVANPQFQQLQEMFPTWSEDGQRH